MDISAVAQVQGCVCAVRVFGRACTVEGHVGGSLPLHTLVSDPARPPYLPCQRPRSFVRPTWVRRHCFLCFRRFGLNLAQMSCMTKLRLTPSTCGSEKTLSLCF